MSSRNGRPVILSHHECRSAKMLTKILISIIIRIFQAIDQALLKFLLSLSSRSRRGPTLHSPTFRISTSAKFLLRHQPCSRVGRDVLLLRKPCPRDHRELFSQLAEELWTIGNGHDGLLHRTSRHLGRSMHQLVGVDLARARDPKDGCGGTFRTGPPTESEVREVFGGSEPLSAGGDGGALKLYAWAPSDNAMKGRKDQSLSMAGSMSWSTPNQLSISGPLRLVSVSRPRFIA